MRALSVLLCVCMLLSCIAARQFYVTDDLIDPTGWALFVNSSYDSVGNHTDNVEIASSNFPQLVVYYGFSVPSNSSTLGGVYINTPAGTIFEASQLTNLGGTSPVFLTSQGVLSPCEVQPPLITLTLAILNYTNFNEKEQGYIQGAVKPVATQLFVPNGLSGVQTAYCCETYFTFIVPADNRTYDVSITLSTINNITSFPFSTVCIKNGFCPFNSEDSCIYYAEIGSSNTSFQIESKKLEGGSYYVRLETLLFQDGTQQYNINATLTIHHEESPVHSHMPYIIGGAVGGAVLLVAVVGIVVYIYRTKRSGYSALN